MTHHYGKGGLQQFARIARRVSSETAWPLKRASGETWADSAAGRALPLGTVSDMPESTKALARGRRVFGRK